MFRGVLIFMLVWLVFTVGLSTWRSWTPQGAWNLGRAVALAGLAAIFTVAMLAAIVFAF